MNEERVEFLLNRYFDESLTAEEREELESQLLSWPQARTLFWKRARFNGMLRRRARENWGRKLALGQAEQDAPASPWRTWWTAWIRPLQPLGWWPVAGVALILILIVLNQSWQPGARRELARTAVASPGGQGVATVLRAVGVQWTGKENLVGNVLKPGWLKFESGWVELQFHRGARVVIEGPAEFELITDMQARCLLGKVSAEVPPPAIGFEILSPNVQVVDRGTSFGLEVARNGPAEVHVFSGRVDLATTSSPQRRRELEQGSAVRIDPGGALSDIPNGPHGFATTDSLEKQANAAMTARLKAWQEYSEQLRQDPSLVLQYTFDSFTDRQLSNMAPRATVQSHGTVIGCRSTEGRWPGKRALDFKQVGDRVRFSLPLQYEEMTCLTWVRLDAFDRPYSALLMSGDAAVGELQWQLRNNGQILFGKRREAGWGYGKLFPADSPPVLSSQRCGSWMQLAFVYNANAKTVSHYLDGQLLNVGPMDANTPLTTRGLEIGNWTPTVGDPVEPIRAFNARMDEFEVFSRALTSEEIHKHWEMGRPL